MDRNPILCAIDTPELARAQALIAATPGAVGGVKLGLEFFTAHGPDGIRQAAAGQKNVFLDLKLHDIPNTVAGAVKSALALDPLLLTIHCSGGAAMMRAAIEARGERAHQDRRRHRADQPRRQRPRRGWAKRAGGRASEAPRAARARERPRRHRVLAAGSRDAARKPAARISCWSCRAFVPRARRSAIRNACRRRATRSPPAPITSSSAGRSPKRPTRAPPRARSSLRYHERRGQDLRPDDGRSGAGGGRRRRALHRLRLLSAEPAQPRHRASGRAGRRCRAAASPASACSSIPTTRCSRTCWRRCRSTWCSSTAARRPTRAAAIKRRFGITVMKAIKVAGELDLRAARRNSSAASTG